ncbi:hypothetical protein BURCENBC7_AP0789 [Burkholderia cenocepacia BC7]|jgi:hypothetical protein|nr:hypothetical protein BURCENBC7_AP0789 [Burkholderia cenocepacia BC7]SPV02424.1 Uncharacterised protein [Burkholderia cenocepacia]
MGIAKRRGQNGKVASGQAQSERVVAEATWMILRNIPVECGEI